MTVISTTVEFVSIFEGNHDFHILSPNSPMTTLCGMRLQAGKFSSFIDNLERVNPENVCDECLPPAPRCWQMINPWALYDF